VVKTGIGLLMLQCLTVFTDQRSLDPKTERDTGHWDVPDRHNDNSSCTRHVRTCSGDISKHNAMISYCA